jgi:hypothetical protein
MNGGFANPFALGTGLLRNHTLTSSPWGHGSYGVAADRFTVGAHSVGEAAMPGKVRLGDRAPTDSGSPATVGAHSVGEAQMPKSFALRTGLLRIQEGRFTVGAHSVGEAAMADRFALRTGLLRGVAAGLAGSGCLASVSTGSIGRATMPACSRQPFHNH